MLHRLVFDTTSVDTIAASANVGAYIRASDGTLIDSVTINTVDRLAVDSTLKDGAGTALTSTLNGAAQSLDVNVTNDLTVDMDGVYDAGTNPLPDSTGSIFHTRAAAPDETNQTFRSTGASPSTDNVDPANVHAIDSNSFMYAWDGAAFDRVTSSGGALDVNIASQDGTVTVSDAALANTAISQAAATVGTSDAALFAAPLANRKYAFVYNNGNRTMYVGAAGVTTASGFPVFPGSILELRAGASVAINAIADAAGQNARVLQLS